ncbi:hypothetical protein T484DRAFT_1789995 [Baffinella frigidus]|nr:hypothetical protein T484DRAFT_1789995 [Cryptophyta sp. CCMP2293]
MAYGLQTAFQNAGLAVFPIVLSGLMPDASSTEALPTLIKWWAEVMMVFVQMSLASVVLTIVLWCIDLRGGGWLNASADVLEKREMEVAREEAEKRHRGTVAAQAAYKTHVHHRNKYLSRLGIRVHGGPRLRPDKPMTAPEWLDPRGSEPPSPELTPPTGW